MTQLRTVISALSCCLLISLSACGGAEEPAPVSEPAPVEEEEAVPAQPVEGLAAEIVPGGDVVISWTEGSYGAVNFVVRRYCPDLSDEPEAIAELEPSASEFRDTTSPDLMLCYRYDVLTVGNVDSAASELVITNAGELPVIRSGVAANTVSDTEVELKWVDSWQEESYHVISTSADGTTLTTEGIARDAESVIVGGLPSNMSHRFELFAANRLLAMPFEAVTGSTLATPVHRAADFAVVIASGVATVTFTAIAGQHTYQVVRTGDPGSTVQWSEDVPAPQGDTLAEVLDTTIVEAARYRYELRVYLNGLGGDFIEGPFIRVVVPISPPD